MQYVRSFSGSVSKTWNSINPSTLSGAIDVIVVEQEDGTLACSPFHVRFGKFQLLRPSDKKVTFTVNGTEQKDIAMKLGEGGEAFFVFETTADVPASLQTSPVVSPAASPTIRPIGPSPPLAEPESLELESTDSSSRFVHHTNTDGLKAISEELLSTPPDPPPDSVDQDPLGKLSHSLEDLRISKEKSSVSEPATPPEAKDPEKTQAMERAITLSTRLWAAKIASRVTESGDLMLDMTGYKDSGDDSKQAETLARQILAEVVEDNKELGDLLGADQDGNVWIYSSAEAKDAAMQSRRRLKPHPSQVDGLDLASDPGYQSEDPRSDAEHDRFHSPPRSQTDVEGGINLLPSLVTSVANKMKSALTHTSFAKTLRLSSDQLKALKLTPGENKMSFKVNRAVCEASMFYWRWDVPIVISDIDGTITKSDALGHVLNMIGRDWTHLGVAKLYKDIVANGYHILYLTSRSVGQADSTRRYLQSVVQEGYRLPKGPVILSPDRTMAALRREVYLRKPEVFKMACLRDIMNLFLKSGASQHSHDGVGKWTPFYAGFGNRLTDALSYRSVNIPSTRIFTINSNAEVSLDLLSLSSFKTGYVSIREIVDHYFPPVSLLVTSGAEEFTDFNFWREPVLDIADFSASETSEEENDYGYGEGEEEEEEEEEEEYEDDDEEGVNDLAQGEVRDEGEVGEDDELGDEEGGREDGGAVGDLDDDLDDGDDGDVNDGDDGHTEYEHDDHESIETQVDDDCAGDVSSEPGVISDSGASVAPSEVR